MRGRTLILLLGSGILLVVATLIGLPFLALRPSSLSSLKPATPPLLQGVSAGSGWNSMGCPRPASAPFLPDREALSPDLTPRLAAAFPAGSAADALRSTLLSQGFQPMQPCQDDPAINRAAFSQTGGGLTGPYPISAVVAWRQAATGQVEWTKGFVSYLAP